MLVLPEKLLERRAQVGQKGRVGGILDLAEERRPSLSVYSLKGWYVFLQRSWTLRGRRVLKGGALEVIW